ncbi:MAG: GNAT family N-acetyltransferase [Patescibacteria group bacterium]
MEIAKVDHIQEAKVLLELDNKAFHRDFDLPSRNLQEQIDYLQGSDVYILYDTHKAVGFFAFKKQEDGIEIMAIVVTPKQQRKGYGKTMMKKLLELTTGNSLHLVTHPKNSGAISYYLKSDFEIYGWKDNYYGDGQPRLLLKRTN